MAAIIHQALVVMMLFSIVPMAIIAISGSVVSLLQAVTQVQEQALVHLVRLVTLALLLVWFGEFAFREIERLFVAVVRVGPTVVSR
jgi:type III secretory pathway component EscS